MRIALLDNRRADAAGEAGTYVAELAPELAMEHRVTILTTDAGLRHLPGEISRIRKMVSVDRPDVVHINNLFGPALAAAAWAIGQERVAGSPSLAIGLHDDQLLGGFTRLNRAVTKGIGLVISPTASLLDQHLAHRFFVDAIGEVIPYAMPYHLARLLDAYRRLIIASRAGDLGNRAA